jgi:pyrroline-5-carboxylate reductase
MAKVGFIGGGNMAEALIKGILSAKVYEKDDIIVSDVSGDRRDYLSREYELEVTEDNTKVANEADILILSVKPQIIDKVLEGIKGELKESGVVVSIAAGVKTEKIKAALGDVPVIRVMPNTPALVGEGASGIFADKKAEKSVPAVKKILDAVGESVEIADEKLMDAVTAVSGSGPAYFFLMMEELIEAGVKEGLEREVAEKLAIQTAKGAAVLAGKARENGESAGDLRKKVTSPGGTTEAALAEFQRAGFTNIVSSAVNSAVKRGKELAG